MSHSGQAKLEREQVEIAPTHFFARIPRRALAFGGICWLAAVATAALGGHELRQQFFFSYLVAFAFFLSIALGGMIFVFIQFAARAGWSVTVRRLAENAMGTLPLFAILFAPLLFGLHDLYHWTHLEHVDHDPILKAKQPYLNQGFFVVRALVYFAIWGFLAYWFRSTSVRQDESGDLNATRRLQKWSGPAIIVYALTSTFAAFDWLMSLEPHWYSTIYGPYIFAGSMVAICAILILASQHLRASGLIGDAINVEHYHDLGKLLFAFTVFWAYMALSQFLLIWYANIPEETAWYAVRFKGSWLLVSLALMIGHFILPFFFLMSRHVKRMSGLLILSSLYLLVLHYVDLYWLVMPTLHDSVQLHWLDVLCFLGIGGVFAAAFGHLLSSASLVPLRDPRLHESLAFENA